MLKLIVNKENIKINNNLLINKIKEMKEFINFNNQNYLMMKKIKRINPVVIKIIQIEFNKMI